MAVKNWRGYEEKDVLDNKALIRDTRTLWQRFSDFLHQSTTVVALIAFQAAVMFLFPATAIPMFLSICLLAWWHVHATAKSHLPFYMPAEHEGKDYNALKPGGGYFDAAGMYFFGNEHNTNAELWGRYNDILRHILIFGTTGGGKTEALVGMAYNMIAAASGFIFVDPKAAPKLQSQIYIMTRMLGRDYDFRTVNYLTAEKSNLPGGATPVRTTNSLNPVVIGNAETLSNMLISLIPKSEGANSIFNQNAQALCRAFMYCWVEKRDAGEIEASVVSIRAHMTLQGCLDFLEDATISQTAKDSMKAFLTSVGWQEGRPVDKQPRSLPEQFGYARGYFGLALNTLTDTYGHIYRPAYGEVDMKDVVRKRRCLVVLLPSLALAPEEIKNLGVITLSSVKNAISIGLGSGKEGVFKDILYTLPTDAPVPFQVITDEYAAIPTPGYIETLTQGRGLGISAIVASQDYAGISKADEEGAQQMLENTFFKICLKLTSAGKTWELFRDIAGDALVVETGGMEIKQTDMAMTYRDNLQATVKERQKIHLADLMAQVEGEFHAVVNGKVVRGYTFYADIPLPESGQLRINQMVQPFIPDRRTLSARFGELRKAIDALKETDRPIGAGVSLPEPAVVQAVRAAFERHPDPMDGAIAAFLAWRRHEDDDLPAPEDEHEPDLGHDDIPVEIDFLAKHDDEREGQEREEIEAIRASAAASLRFFSDIREDLEAAAQSVYGDRTPGAEAAARLSESVNYPSEDLGGIEKWDNATLRRNIAALLDKIKRSRRSS